MLLFGAYEIELNQLININLFDFHQFCVALDNMLIGLDGFREDLIPHEIFPSHPGR
jgi:hypothetical protein